LDFEWDDAKAAVNRRKHGVSFQEAAAAWLDPNAIDQFDRGHSADEERWARIGMSDRPRLLLVVYTERHGDTIRIISARKANRAEAKAYAEAQS
jgi:uncharacterized DUF497 family protein